MCCKILSSQSPRRARTSKKATQVNIFTGRPSIQLKGFEKIGPSLYDYLHKNNFLPFPIDLVREIGKQLLESIAYMHDLKLFYTDLKPENTLFVSSDFVKVPDYKVAHCRSAKYFTHRTRLDWPEGDSSRESIRAVRKVSKLENYIKKHVDHSAGFLIDLLQGLLKFEPSERLTAREVLRHPFFKEDFKRKEIATSSLL